MNRFILAAGLVLLAACDRPNEPPPPAAAPAPPFPPLPEIKPTEEFAKDDYLELPAEGAASFAWDLGQDVHHNYSYEQESHLVMTVTAGPDSAQIVSRTQWKGGGEVIGGGEGRGELSFVASPVAQWNNNKPLSSEELNKVKKMILRYQLGQDGVFSIPQVLSGQEDPKLELFFALPSRELKPGDSETREVHLTHVEEDLRYHGTQRIAHAGRRKVGRYECVKLRSRVDLEATPPGDGNGRLTGWIAAYFAPKEGKFVRVDANFVMAVDVRREMPPKDPAAKPVWQFNRAQADTRVRLELRD